MRKKGRFAGIFIFLLMVGAGVLGYFLWQEKKNTENLTGQVTALEEEMATNSKTAWVTLDEIHAGEELVPDENVELRQIFSGVDSGLFWSPEEGFVASTDISMGVPIFSSMVTEYVPEADDRNYEISAVTLMSTQEEYDYVDIRVSFPDGSDYIVLSKKQINDLSLANCVFNITASESEIQRMQSAILDTYMTTGAMLYTTEYKEAGLQQAAAVNYPVKDSTLLMLMKENNVNVREALNQATAELNRQARRNLEERLGLITDEEAQAAQQAWQEKQTKFQAELQQRILEQQQQGY